MRRRGVLLGITAIAAIGAAVLFQRWAASDQRRVKSVERAMRASAACTPHVSTPDGYQGSRLPAASATYLMVCGIDPAIRLVTFPDNASRDRDEQRHEASIRKRRCVADRTVVIDVTLGQPFERLCTELDGRLVAPVTADSRAKAPAGR